MPTTFGVVVNYEGWELDMETLVYNCIVQASCLSPETWDGLCSYWGWSFWIAFFLGLIGSVVSFLSRSVD